MLDIGTHVVLTSDAKENEGYASFADKTLRITHAANKYMPAAKFFAQGKPEGYHPGYDGATGDPLYDLETLDGEPISCSLYGWEIKQA